MKSAYKENVLPDMAAWRRSGLKTALVTLVRIEGVSPRPLGSQMAVNENGEACGLITGGCAEAAIIAEAQDVIAKGANRCVRFGVGSPYMDVRLPCGSGIDVFFDATLPGPDVDALLAAQDARRPAAIAFDLARLKTGLCAPEMGAACDEYVKTYAPDTKLLIIGKGAATPFTAQMARAAGFEVHVFSPEAETLEDAKPFCATVAHLTSDEQSILPAMDLWTAVVTLFHEHEWELNFLQSALRSDCFYIGALGSRRTHADRLSMLREKGMDEKNLQRISGPVGIDIGAKSPPEIALSIIAEIVETRRRLDL